MSQINRLAMTHGDEIAHHPPGGQIVFGLVRVSQVTNHTEQAAAQKQKIKQPMSPFAPGWGSKPCERLCQAEGHQDADAWRQMQRNTGAIAERVFPEAGRDEVQ